MEDLMSKAVKVEEWEANNIPRIVRMNCLDGYKLISTHEIKGVLYLFFTK